MQPDDPLHHQSTLVTTPTTSRTTANTGRTTMRGAVLLLIGALALSTNAHAATVPSKTRNGVTTVTQSTIVVRDHHAYQGAPHCHSAGWFFRNRPEASNNEEETWKILRGGDGNGMSTPSDEMGDSSEIVADDRSENDAPSADSPTRSSQAVTSSSDTPQEQKSKRGKPVFLSLFQVNDRVKAETLAAREEPDRCSQNRGGAMVKQLPPPAPSSPATSRNFLFKWFGGSSSTNNNIDELQQDRRDKTNLKGTVLQQAERLWWNNAWMDATTQIPVQPQELVVNDDENLSKIETNKKNDMADSSEESSQDICIVLDEDDGSTKQSSAQQQKLKQQPQQESDDEIIPVEVEEVEEEVKNEKTKPKKKHKRKRKHKHKHHQHAKKDEGDEGTLVVSSKQAESETMQEKEEQEEDAKKDATTIKADKDREPDQDQQPDESNRTSDELAVTFVATPYTSSGAWVLIDGIMTLGYANFNDAWKISRSLRPFRKSMAYWTGLHGFLSGKPKSALSADEEGVDALQDDALRKRLAAIDRARGNVERAEEEERIRNQEGRRPFWRRNGEKDKGIYSDGAAFVRNRQALEQEKMRRQRLAEIDKLQETYGQTLAELATEKELLLNIPNPLWNYTSTLEELEEARDQEAQRKQQLQIRTNSKEGEGVSSSNETTRAERSDGDDDELLDASKIAPTREFNFPSDDLVDEYLDMLVSSKRLIKLNHTNLWKNNGRENAVHADDEDDEEWLSAEEIERQARETKRRGDAGSRWLRNGLGEKIGVAVEMVAYKAVCHNVMGILAKSLSAMHGATVMGHSEICLQTENIPILPPLAGDPGTGSYASQAFQNVIRKTTTPSSPRRKKRKRKQADFVQRQAVAEQLLSQCQIACPLLKLFPLAWQRALIGNIISVITSVIGDFIEGLEFEILGHKLSLTFQPITEQDMMKSLERSMSTESTLTYTSFHQHPARSLQAFESAVEETTKSLAESLNFLDRWHERVLGGDQIRTQVAALIARLVLSLIDDILCQSRMDLWSSHAGGPRLLAGLYYRSPSSAPSIRHERSPAQPGV